MNSNHSSKLLVLSAIVLVVGALGVAGATSVDAPESAKVGTETNATVTFSGTELYDTYRQWQLRGFTQLENATWSIVGTQPDGDVVVDTTYPKRGSNGTTFTYAVNSSRSLARLEITVRGTVPDLRAYNYTDPQTFVMAEFTRIKGGSRERLDTIRVHYYTSESRRARGAIDSARAAVNGSGSGSAKATLEDAKEFYNAGEFQNAIDTAKRAKSIANQAQQRSQLVQTAIYVVIALVLLGGAGGAIWWYRKNQQASRL